ncbi:Uncharacterised protein [Vibrio cholerae]|nr:Uncharacterised protein [Vibrio cholerae]
MSISRMMFSVLLKSPSDFNGVTERFSKVNWIFK